MRTNKRFQLTLSRVILLSFWTLIILPISVFSFAILFADRKFFNMPSLTSLFPSAGIEAMVVLLLLHAAFGIAFVWADR